MTQIVIKKGTVLLYGAWSNAPKNKNQLDIARLIKAHRGFSTTADTTTTKDNF